LAFIEGTIPVKGIHGFILYAGLPAAASLKHLEQAASGDCAAQDQIARANASCNSLKAFQPTAGNH
jgi:hypothetical protein